MGLLSCSGTSDGEIYDACQSALQSATGSIVEWGKSGVDSWTQRGQNIFENYTKAVEECQLQRLEIKESISRQELENTSMMMLQHDMDDHNAKLAQLFRHEENLRERKKHIIKCDAGKESKGLNQAVIVYIIIIAILGVSCFVSIIGNICYCI